MQSTIEACGQRSDLAGAPSSSPLSPSSCSRHLLRPGFRGRRTGREAVTGASPRSTPRSRTARWRSLTSTPPAARRPRSPRNPSETAPRPRAADAPEPANRPGPAPRGSATMSLPRPGSRRSRRRSRSIRIRLAIECVFEPEGRSTVW